MTRLAQSPAGIAPSAVPARLARSWHLVSALRTDEAARSRADAVVLDLEDAVPAADKEGGRRSAAAYLASRSAWVRLNDVTSPHWIQDIRAVGASEGLLGVVLAKTELAADVARTALSLPPGTRIVALIESAQGLEAASEIARQRGTFRLAFGSGDFRRDTGMHDDPVALAYPRSRLVVASAAARLPGPIDGPTLTDSAAGVSEAARASRVLGMTGKLMLRSTQAEPINEALSPSPDELAWARDTVEGSSDPSTIDGSYLPALARARATLALAADLGMPA
ncbi:HpcH/HpaI aldolase/citrate lyase family protein [Leifsonia xyli]|uniref:HpcH/HpaI aldolase/citrate lyase family protein n=1 Tax=Leifsonia xyli TaxID=1575 RepID=UPI003D67B979